MLGAFICPNCKTKNACCCENCITHVKEGEPVIKWTEDGNRLICANCGNIFSEDEAIDEEFKSKPS